MERKKSLRYEVNDPRGTNEKLGLPFGKMQKVVFAFDVDGTLIQEEDTYVHIVDMLKTVSKFKNVLVAVWSGGGESYARMIGHRLGIDDYVDKYMSKTEWKALRDRYVVIAVDDIQDTAIGDINLIVRNK